MTNRNSLRLTLTLGLILISTHVFADTFISSNLMGANYTWTIGGSPYIITTAIKVGSATLTIQPGVTVKFQSNASLTIGFIDAFGMNQPGNLYILGTSASPVLLTADSGSPTPGFWSSITLNPQAGLPVSSIQYAQIEYSAYGLWIDSISPDIHSCIFKNNQYRAIGTNGSVVINSYQNSFIGNGKAIEVINSTSSTSVKSILSWWNHISGPSGAGTGTGQFASVGTKFEPWLETAPDYTNELNSASIVNRTFNPTAGIFDHINFGSVASATWTVTFINSSSQIVRTFTGTGQSTNIVWDGKNDSGAPQPAGTYTYRIQSSGSATATAKVVINTTAPAITGVAVTKAFFNPNVGAKTTLSANYNFDGGQWTVNVRSPGNTIIRSTTASGFSLSWIWDGKDSNGIIQSDGVYTFEIIVVDDSSNVSTTKTVTLDLIYPVASLTYPTQNLVVSNIYQNNSIAITGTATDLNLETWYVYKCNPSCGTQLATGTTPKSNALLYTWNTASEPNGNYKVNLKVRDKAANETNVFVDVVIGNFSLSQNVRQINASTGQTVSYSMIIPFTLNANVFIKNSLGQSVRTLNNGSLDPGAPPLVFNGRDNSNNLLPDGPYFVVAYVTKDTFNLTWDQTNQFVGTALTYVHPPATTNWDPYNNNPLPVSITLPDARRITVEIGNILNEDCSAPSLCLVTNEYQPSGTYTYVWTGVDNQGILRPDLRYFIIVGQQANFSKNAVVVFGTKPTISNLILSPPLFKPLLANQNITFNMSTYQNQPANVTITIFNQASRSILRTINQNNVAAGAVSIPWNGLADNGMRISADPYLITVTVIDAMGQQTIGKALMQTRY
jgi:flagellar hook assembly protein FlgD